MATQLQVTWTIVGGDEVVEVTSEFGRLDRLESNGAEPEALAPVERVLEPESSTLAAGLSTPLA